MQNWRDRTLKVLKEDVCKRKFEVKLMDKSKKNNRTMNQMEGDLVND